MKKGDGGLGGKPVKPAKGREKSAPVEKEPAPPVSTPVPEK